MNGWAFGAWVLVGVAIYAMIAQTRRHQEEVTRLTNENAILWEQVGRFNEAFAEVRATQAVTN